MHPFVEQRIQIHESRSRRTMRAIVCFALVSQHIPEQILQEAEVLPTVGPTDAVQQLNRMRQRLSHIRVGAIGKLTDLTSGTDHVAVGRRSLHQPRIVLCPNRRRELVDQLVQVSLSARLLQSALGGEFGRHCDLIDRFVAIKDREDCGEDRLVPRVHEIAGFEHASQTLVDAVLGQDRAQHRLLRCLVLGHPARSRTRSAVPTVLVGQLVIGGIARNHDRSPQGGRPEWPGQYGWLRLGLDRFRFFCGLCFGLGFRCFRLVDFGNDLVEAQIGAVGIGLDDHCDFGGDVAGQPNPDFLRTQGSQRLW